MAGEAKRTNSLLLRAYYRAGCPIPRAPKVQEYRGALCEVHKRGVIRDVWHADIASLYPTTMLLFDCLPKADTLGVIRAILTDLRDYRLAAKAAAESAVDPKEKTRWDALQGTFKIAINAIYGYLGTPGGNFADFDAAGMVTAIGRCLMARMRDWLAARGATIIEIDTDGIFFSPPAGAFEGADLEELKRGLSAQLPRGMTLNFDRHYVAMFSYKSKNCALLADDGKIMVKGGSLRSRALEPFLRRYQTTVLQLLLAGREAEVPKLYNDTLWALQHHEFPLEELAESKTLRKSLEEYEFKLNNGGNPMAQYEVATSSEQEYLRGDKVLFYYTAPGPEEKRGSQYKHAKSLPRGATPERDEDVELYIKKLNQVAMRFDEFAPGRIPWRPERKNRKKIKPKVARS
jgi:DNA polymerase elongation subunit (family B)